MHAMVKNREDLKTKIISQPTHLFAHGLQEMDMLRVMLD